MNKTPKPQKLVRQWVPSPNAQRTKSDTANVTGNDRHLLKSFSLRIDPDVFKSIKLLAEMKGVTITSIFEAAARKLLADNDDPKLHEKSKQKPFKPPEPQ